MTLVLSCITRDFVMQVSDRRLTYLDGRPPDDETNKAVFVLGRVLMSFTGVGYIAGTVTHIWTVERLANLSDDPNKSLDVAFKQFTNEASGAFQRISGREAKRHAFVGVGWGQRRSDPSDLHPFIWTISNTLDQNANWLPLAERRFTMQQRLLAPGEPYFLLTTGQPLTPSEDTSIRRNIR